MSNREAIRKLLGLLADYKKAMIFIVACLLVTSGLNLCIPILSRDIMDLGFIGGDRRVLIQLIIASTLIYFINSVISLIKEKKRISIAARLEYSLSEKSFLHLTKLRISYYDRTNHSEILSNLNTDIGNMSTIVDQT